MTLMLTIGTPQSVLCESVPSLKWQYQGTFCTVPDTLNMQRRDRELYPQRGCSKCQRYTHDDPTSTHYGLPRRVSPTMKPLAPVYSAFCNTSSQVRTLPLLTTGTPVPSTRAFTTDRSAAPRLRWRVDGWRACNARKAAPAASRLVASVSVDDAGLHSRNLAETGTLRDRDRDVTCDVFNDTKACFFSSSSSLPI